MKLYKTINGVLKIFGISSAGFIVGLLIRLSIQSIMGTKVIWLTFYPAIMISALLGGLFSGLISILYTMAFAFYGWMFIASDRFIASPPDVIGAVVFVLNTVMMSLVAWGMRRANARCDNQNDSDYDVLVVVDGSEKQNRTTVLDEGYSILDEWQQWIGVIVNSPEYWQSARNTPLGWNILHEGLRLI